MSPDPDDDIGRRLGVLLAPPEALQASSDAGSRLRAQARTVARRRRGAALAAIGIIALAAVTLAGRPSPTDHQPANGRWSGAGWLTTPVEIGTGTVVPGQQSCAGAADLVRVGPDCLRVTDSPLIIRQVSGIRVVARAAGAAALELDLVYEDQGEVNKILNTGRGGHLVAFVDGVPHGATFQPNHRLLEIAASSVTDADQFVAILGLRPNFDSPTGPGDLKTPLTVRPVLSSTDPPCTGTAVEHDRRCLTLGAPIVAVRSVPDLALLGPDRKSTDVRILVEFPGAASATLGAYSAAHTGEQLVFEVGGRPVGRTYPINHRVGRTMEMQLADQDEAEQVFRQLRPRQNWNKDEGGG